MRIDDTVNIHSQDNWRWCNKCEGLWFAGRAIGTAGGKCPSDGGSHDFTGSGNYRLAHYDPDAPGQTGWRWCHQCEGLWYSERAVDGKGGWCPARGPSGEQIPHDLADSGEYTLVHNDPNAPGQPEWRWCHQCEGLWFAGHSGSSGRCPQPGANQHSDESSGDYKLSQ